MIPTNISINVRIVLFHNVMEYIGYPVIKDSILKMVNVYLAIKINMVSIILIKDYIVAKTVKKVIGVMGKLDLR